MTWPELPAGLVLVEAGDTLVLVDTATGAVHTPGPLSALILRHREVFHDRDDAAAELSEVFGISADEATSGLVHLEDLLRGAVGEQGHDSFLRRGRRWGPTVVVPETVDSELTIDALGYGIRLVCHSRELTGAVTAAFQSFAVCEAAKATVDVWLDDPAIRIAVDGRLVSTEADITMSMFRLTTLVTALAADESPLPVLVHSAAVVVQGRAWLLAGRSNQGKSSTTVELMYRGAGYLTDEVVAITPRAGLVSGLARPIGLEGRYREARPELAPHPVTGDECRWAVPPDLIGRVEHEAPLGGIFILQYDHATENTSLSQIGAQESLSLLVPLMYRRSRLASGTLEHLFGLLEVTPAFVLTHGGADEAATQIIRIAGTS